MANQSSDMAMDMVDRASLPVIIVQKKGERQIFYIPLSKINCWEDLLTSLHHLFTFSFSSPPSIQTFEGNLVTENTYLEYVKPNAHFFLNFPPDLRFSENVLRRMNEHLSPRMSSANASYSIAFMKKDPTGGTASVQSFSPCSNSHAFRNELEAAEARERKLGEQRHALHAHSREEFLRFNQYSTGSRPPSEMHQLSVATTPPSAPLSPYSYGTPSMGRRPSTTAETPSSVSQLSAISPYMSDDQAYRQASHSLTPATEVDYVTSETGWNFSRSPNVWYPSADPWTTVDGKNEQKRLGIPEFPSRDQPVIESTTTEKHLDHFGPEPVQPPATSQAPLQTYPAPVLPSFSTDDMQLSPGFPISNTIEQVLAQGDPKLSHLGESKKKNGQPDEEPSSVRSQSPLDAQWDRIETPDSSSILLCPHITFHCTRPIDLKIRITPTVTVIPPSDPLEHDRMYATAVGEHINLGLSIEGNGKITRIVSEPEGTEKPEKITLLKKSQAKGSGGRWYISRMETQLEGGWGSAPVGELGGHGDDGKKRNPGIILDWSFKGEQNEKRSFAVAYDKLSEFLDLFMDTCGYPKRERQTMINFWARRLPQEPSEDGFLLIKLLPVKDLITLLPIQTDPPPDRTVRFFIILRRATREIVKQEGLKVKGEMARVVYEVLGSKPPPVVPATRNRRRGRGKGKLKGPYGDSNAAMREAERPVGTDPNPRVPVEGGSGLTIFEYGGVLMANHAAEGRPSDNALPIPPEVPTNDEAESGQAQGAESEHSPEANQVEQQSVIDNTMDHSMEVDSIRGDPQRQPPTSPQSYIGPPHMQPEIQMSNFAAQPPDEVISTLYYGTNEQFLDPYHLYTHQDLELHDPNQQIFSVVGTQPGYTAGFFGAAPIQQQPPPWGWPASSGF